MPLRQPTMPPGPSDGTLTATPTTQPAQTPPHPHHHAPPARHARFPRCPLPLLLPPEHPTAAARPSSVHPHPPAHPARPPAGALLRCPAIDTPSHPHPPPQPCPCILSHLIRPSCPSLPPPTLVPCPCPVVYSCHRFLPSCLYCGAFPPEGSTPKGRPCLPPLLPAPFLHSTPQTPNE